MVSVASEKLVPTLRERLSDMGVKGVSVARASAEELCNVCLERRWSR